MQFPVIPHNMQELEKLGTPQALQGNMEAVPYELYDTQTFVQGTTTALTFFTQPDTANGFLTNMKQGGQLPNPDMFMPYVTTLDIIGVEPGDFARLRDLYRLIFGTGTAGAPYATFSYATKTYPGSGGYGLPTLSSAGGPTGFTTRTAVEYANSGIPGQGGLRFGMDAEGNSSILILPLQAFSWQLRWSAPVTLTADVQIKMTMHGTYYRQIR